jgi:DNA-binding response OmpR family regulator
VTAGHVLAALALAMVSASVMISYAIVPIRLAGRSSNTRPQRFSRQRFFGVGLVIVGALTIAGAGLGLITDLVAVTLPALITYAATYIMLPRYLSARSRTITEKWSARGDPSDTGAPAWEAAKSLSPKGENWVDDRANVTQSDHVILIIELQQLFVPTFLGVAHDRGLKSLVARDAFEALLLARRFVPDAIIIDMDYINVDGWELLDQFKGDPVTKHIPVVLTSSGDLGQRASSAGALHLDKRVSLSAFNEFFDQLLGFAGRNLVSNVLIVADDIGQVSAIANFFQCDKVSLTVVSTGAQALQALDAAQFACVVVDLGLQNTDVIQLINEIERHPSHVRVPVIVYTSRSPTEREDEVLGVLADAVVVHNNAFSSERLTDAVSSVLKRSGVTTPGVGRPLEVPSASDVSSRPG